jgi:hypothetical protein
VAVTLLASACGTGARVIEDSAAIKSPPSLPPSTTSTTNGSTPYCAAPVDPTGGVPTTLASPTSNNLLYSAIPGGPAVGHVIENWGGPSTRPVVAESNGWVQIRLESRPDGSTGWIPAQNVTLTSTPYAIVVSICQRTLTIFSNGTAVYAAFVGVGQARWPTPVGATYIDSVVNTPARQQYIYGPTVYILGTHSNVFTDFDGGDGTVAIHGYPSDPGSTRGVASSHGCVRSSPTTINAIKVVPVGTPVSIVA